MFLGEHVPPLIGHAIVDLIAGLVNWLKPKIYRILYANPRRATGWPERSA